ncbi:hypothetical protein HYH03_007015 [Edaphochlamys debaryana]|uniref:Uncharacterized protein n=1 Tax=Edaphochlamys debaryana TaxID=47281 RepID=A0A836BZG6_9CHLO|nr:hypothetical protein HYH03_007015 [Edaphochlamys debaryana]|eukprot:KAG2494771.1 hypothetical protein HYH03_007015 [Edaphochlamys debaryana]
MGHGANEAAESDEELGGPGAAPVQPAAVLAIPSARGRGAPPPASSLPKPTSLLGSGRAVTSPIDAAASITNARNRAPKPSVPSSIDSDDAWDVLVRSATDALRAHVEIEDLKRKESQPTAEPKGSMSAKVAASKCVRHERSYEKLEEDLLGLPAAQVAVRLAEEGAARHAKAAGSGGAGAGRGGGGGKGAGAAEETSLLDGVRTSKGVAASLSSRAVVLLSAHILMHQRIKRQQPDSQEAAQHLGNAILLADALLVRHSLPALPYPELFALAWTLHELRTQWSRAHAREDMGAGLPRAAPPCVASLQLWRRLVRAASASVRLDHAATAEGARAAAATASGRSRKGKGTAGRRGANEEVPEEAPALADLCDRMETAISFHLMAIDHSASEISKTSAAAPDGAKQNQRGPFRNSYEQRNSDMISTEVKLLKKLIAWDSTAAAMMNTGLEYTLEDLSASGGVALGLDLVVARAVRPDLHQRLRYDKLPVGREAQPGPARLQDDDPPAWQTDKWYGRVCGRGGGGADGRDALGERGVALQRLDLGRLLIEASLDGAPKRLTAIGPTALRLVVSHAVAAARLRAATLPHPAAVATRPAPGQSAASSPSDSHDGGPLLLRFSLPEAPAAKPTSSGDASAQTLGIAGAACAALAPVQVTLLPCGARAARRAIRELRYARRLQRQMAGPYSGGGGGSGGGVPRDFRLEVPSEGYALQRHANGVVSLAEGGLAGEHMGLLRACLAAEGYGCCELLCRGPLALQAAALLIAQAEADLRAAGANGPEAADLHLEVLPGICDAFEFGGRLTDAVQEVVAATLEEGQPGGALAADWAARRRLALNHQACALLGLLAEQRGSPFGVSRPPRLPLESISDEKSGSASQAPNAGAKGAAGDMSLRGSRGAEEAKAGAASHQVSAPQGAGDQDGESREAAVTLLVFRAQLSGERDVK